jgi:hypothetical protein
LTPAAYGSSQEFLLLQDFAAYGSKILQQHE